MRVLMTKSLSLTSYFMASATRNAIMRLILVIMNLFYLVASIEAFRDPKVLLDEEYQTSLHDSFLLIIASYYISFLTIFLLSLLQKIYCSLGYKNTFKELDEIKIFGKKEMQQYHIDTANREQMKIEEQHLRATNNLHFYIGLIIVAIFLLVIRKKVKAFLKKREDLRRFDKLASKWKILQCTDNENCCNECIMCLLPFGDNDLVTQLPCHHSHRLHKNCFDKYVERSVDQGNQDVQCPFCR